MIFGYRCHFIGRSILEHRRGGGSRAERQVVVDEVVLSWSPIVFVLQVKREVLFGREPIMNTSSVLSRASRHRTFEMSVMSLSVAFSLVCSIELLLPNASWLVAIDWSFVLRFLMAVEVGLAPEVMRSWSIDMQLTSIMIAVKYLVVHGAYMFEPSSGSREDFACLTGPVKTLCSFPSWVILVSSPELYTFDELL